MSAFYLISERVAYTELANTDATLNDVDDGCTVHSPSVSCWYELWRRGPVTCKIRETCFIYHLE